MDQLSILHDAFRKDPNPNKRNFLKSTVKLSCIDDIPPNKNHSYLPWSGDPEFLSIVRQRFSLPRDRPVIQTNSNTSALYLLLRTLPQTSVYTDTPTWSNYPYMASQTRKTFHSFANKANNCNILSELEDIRDSIIILQPILQNPLGYLMDPHLLTSIACICERNNNAILFDVCYFGYAEFRREKRLLQHILTLHGDTHICFSFSKNMGLFGERIGFLATQQHLMHSLNCLIRTSYSCPSRNGAYIVRNILEHKYIEWLKELDTNRYQCIERKYAIIQGISSLLTKEQHEMLAAQQGWFITLTFLSPSQIHDLLELGIYTYNGRITLSGIERKEDIELLISSLVTVMSPSKDQTIEHSENIIPPIKIV